MSKQKRYRVVKVTRKYKYNRVLYSKYQVQWYSEAWWKPLTYGWNSVFLIGYFGCEFLSKCTKYAEYEYTTKEEAIEMIKKLSVEIPEDEVIYQEISQDITNSLK